jgi:hypothetical protein
MTRRRIVVGLALLAVVAGLVVAYHPRHDPVLGSVALDQYSSMLVVDARTARAFVGDGSCVHVLDTATGALLRTVPVAPSRAGVDHLAVAEQVGRVVVLGDSFSGSPPFVGYVSVLDAHSGRFLHTTPVSMGNITWLAVDAQARRAVVASLPDYMQAGAVPDPVRAPVRVSVLDAASGRLVRALLATPRRQGRAPQPSPTSRAAPTAATSSVREPRTCQTGGRSVARRRRGIAALRCYVT